MAVLFKTPAQHAIALSSMLFFILLTSSLAEDIDILHPFGRIRLVKTIVLYEHAVVSATATMPQSEFGITGPTQSIPFNTSYTAIVNSKLTSEPTYNSTELGRAIGLISAASPREIVYVTFDIVFTDGSLLAITGIAYADNRPNFTYAITGGTGKYLGTFGELVASLVSNNGGNLVLKYVLKLYTYV